MELTDGLGADVAMKAIGISDTFELAADLIRPGGHVANVGVHGHPATLHLETMAIRNVTITTGLVDTHTIPQLMRLVADGRLDPTAFATHRYVLGDTMAAYDTFIDAASTDALKVVLQAGGRGIRAGSPRRRRGHGIDHDCPDAAPSVPPEKPSPSCSSGSRASNGRRQPALAERHAQHPARDTGRRTAEPRA